MSTSELIRPWSYSPNNASILTFTTSGMTSMTGTDSGFCNINSTIPLDLSHVLSNLELSLEYIIGIDISSERQMVDSGSLFEMQKCCAPVFMQNQKDKTTWT